MSCGRLGWPPSLFSPFRAIPGDGAIGPLGNDKNPGHAATEKKKNEIKYEIKSNSGENQLETKVNQTKELQSSVAIVVVALERPNGARSLHYRRGADDAIRNKNLASSSPAAANQHRT